MGHLLHPQSLAVALNGHLLPGSDPGVQEDRPSEGRIIDIRRVADGGLLPRNHLIRDLPDPRIHLLSRAPRAALIPPGAVLVRNRAQMDLLQTTLEIPHRRMLGHIGLIAHGEAVLVVAELGAVVLVGHAVARQGRLQVHLGRIRGNIHFNGRVKIVVVISPVAAFPQVLDMVRNTALAPISKQEAHAIHVAEAGSGQLKGALTPILQIAQ